MDTGVPIRVKILNSPSHFSRTSRVSSTDPSARITTLDEEGVRIVAIGQDDTASAEALRAEALC